MIRLELVEYHLQKMQVKKIIENHHSYVPSNSSVGRRIDWLIYHSEHTNVLGIEEPVGMIGIGSSVYPPPKDLLSYVGMTKSEYKDNFNSFANNWRFCMTTPIPNAGSQVLKQLRFHAPLEWKKKYKNFLTHLLTFVGGGNNGAVYKSDNWEMIGETSGLPSHNMVSMKWDSKEELKTKFVKPTGENKKLIFVTQIK
tara:strand:- start:344 stop:934 length:591 start_codon:yes stop_codon:yes gene_type:complete